MIYCVGQKWGWVPSSEAKFEEKTPEMNELETDTSPLKISAHNFEKQKSWSALKNIKRQTITSFT